VPSEMLSGPDLGGGYLHQLTLDRDGDRTTYTYHAQDGGQDAGGPAKGPLDRLGWAHPPSACQFGGPRCWHRRFLLPFSEAPRVRAAYNRTRFVMETMLDQAFAARPPAVDAALREVVARLRAPLAQEGLPWYVGGSAAAWLLGARVDPADLDLGTTRTGVDRIADLLREYLIEPVGPTDWPGSGIVQGARAFVGTFQDGARAEWAVRLDTPAREPEGEWSARPAEVRLLPVPFAGGTLDVTRPEYGLVRAEEAGRPERVPALVEIVRKLGPDRELLDRLLEHSTLPADARHRIRRSVDV
jgi:hypothetical protein